METGKFKNRFIAYLLLAPTLIILAVFLYYPMLQTFKLSAYQVAFLGLKQKFVGLQNYIKILTDDFYFRVGFTNLVLIVVTNILKTVTVPLLVAELIFNLRNAVHRYI
ncbi:MAG: sugar ABC transporter permease, partial [Chloroflexi bacterium]